MGRFPYRLISRHMSERIVYTFKIVKIDDKEETIPHYARFVPYTEITNKRNDCNLNVSRYITPVDTEIQQDLYAHLKLNGGLPAKDVEEGFSYLWRHCPTLKDELFEPLEKNYYKLCVGRNEIPNTITHNKEFSTLSGFFSEAVEEWYKLVSQQMLALAPGCQPKKLIADWSESLLEMLSEIDSLVDKYTIYDILLNYWNSAMQDDCYLISRYGWTVELSCDVLTTDKKSKEVRFVPKKNPTFRDYNCDLLPVHVVINRYFQKENDAVNKTEERVSQLKGEIEQMEEEYSEELNDTVNEITNKYFYAICPKPLNGEKEILEAFLKINEKGKIGKEKREAIIAENRDVFDRLNNLSVSAIKYRLKEVVNYAALPDDTIKLYKQYIDLNKELANTKTDVKQKISKLTKLIVEKYPTLQESEIKDMVINDKWHTAIVGGAISAAFDVTVDIEQQVTALVDRYVRRLSDIDVSVRNLEEKVNTHLAKMGFEL